jgi:hypothetical protein
MAITDNPQRCQERNAEERPSSCLDSNGGSNKGNEKRTDEISGNQDL